MKRLVLLALFAAACRPAESATQSASSAAGTGSAANQQRTSSADSAAAEALLMRADKARIQGDSSAKIWIVEVSDFQCPYCKMFHDSTYATIKREFIATGQARMAYVNYPISSHANAVPAAEAAMCAATQDKFWAMHDALFNSQDTWAPMPDPSKALESQARKVGVDIAAWRACVQGGVMKRLISADRQRGSSAGVNSTPYFFIGDEVVRGAAPPEAFRAAMKKARDKAAANTKQ